MSIGSASPAKEDTTQRIRMTHGRTRTSINFTQHRHLSSLSLHFWAVIRERNNCYFLRVTVFLGLSCMDSAYILTIPRTKSQPMDGAFLESVPTPVHSSISGWKEHPGKNSSSASTTNNAIDHEMRPVS
jgi:hypothetical protein